MTDTIDLFRELADEPDEFEHDAGVVSFVRHGKEQILTIREVPGSGPSVEERGSEGQVSWVPVASYVQSRLLQLPLLATQVTKTLQRVADKRPGRFIEGPGQFVAKKQVEETSTVLAGLRRYLSEAEFGTTRILQLMAAAGQGKTVLLENASIAMAEAYQPDPHPSPLLLNVDLLGRYVGTIDDAIAGSLNNTYLFPGLTQRDVSLSVRSRWLILALDGFDELVARVGIRDAFLRIAELLDQLRGSGTIILSARESFFELYQISAGIRTHLQPRRGSYSTNILRLTPWNRCQANKVFSGVGSPDPEKDLEELLGVFEGDEEIVFHPFFLTRLAELWMKGERFAAVGDLPGRLARTKYVIETFVARESHEKWVDRDHNPLLDTEGHGDLLGGVAEEMWRAGAFRLDEEELRISGEIGLSNQSLPADLMEKILERLPTHAALTYRDKGYAFLHERFLHYYLGRRVSKLIQDGDEVALGALFSSREMAPTVIDWSTWQASRLGTAVEDIASLLNSLVTSEPDTTLSSNVGAVAARLVDVFDLSAPITFRGMVFLGEALTGRTYSQVHFDRCRFWNADLSDTVFQQCKLTHCEIADVRVSERTSFQDTALSDTEVEGLELPSGSTLFVPGDLHAELVRRGADILDLKEDVSKKTVTARASTDAIFALEQYIKASENTCDVAVEEMRESAGRAAKQVARIGLKAGVLKEVSKSVSGPKRHFVRFLVDRDRLLRAQTAKSRDPSIEEFWNQLAERFPPER